ncbi:MAG: hypothetical protein KUG51_00415 [Urechidicola sp.]|nr:hypothetical protein [Urechidicola sp.]
MPPKFLKIALFSLLLINSIANTFGQLEDPKTKTTVPIDQIQPNIEVDKHIFIDPRIVNDEEIKRAIEEVLKDMLDEEERQKLKTKGILTEEQKRKEIAKKRFAELDKNYKKVDQYLGGFSTTSKHATIVCRDFQYPDGDAITIYINDQPVIQNIVLTTAYQQFTLPLVEGLNVISFKALNQGSSGPNTAAFAVFDDEAKMISSNEWNLATGAKATLTIARVSEE